jgi:excisionase family DNA binding protein
MHVAVDFTSVLEELEAIVRRVLREELGQRQDNGWLDVKAAAEYLGTSVGAVQSATTAGKLPCHRSADGRRRYRRSELDAYCQAGDN